jgi:hypothetical protein
VGAAPGLRGVATEAPDLSHKLQGRDTSLPQQPGTLHSRNQEGVVYQSVCKYP